MLRRALVGLFWHSRIPQLGPKDLWSRPRDHCLQFSPLGGRLECQVDLSLFPQRKDRKIWPRRLWTCRERGPRRQPQQHIWLWKQRDGAGRDRAGQWRTGEPRNGLAVSRAWPCSSRAGRPLQQGSGSPPLDLGCLPSPPSDRCGRRELSKLLHTVNAVQELHLDNYFLKLILSVRSSTLKASFLPCLWQ